MGLMSRTMNNWCKRLIPTSDAVVTQKAPDTKQGHAQAQAPVVFCKKH
jgi:hypothetical protein